MSLLNTIAALLIFTSLCSYINIRYLRLPSSIFMTAIGALSSIIVLAIFTMIDGQAGGDQIRNFVKGIDFEAALMEGMLSFLLFAGAMHVDWDAMRRNGVAVILLSTIGVILSTVVVGAGLYFVSGLLGIDLPVMWCLVFGALISPTDPVSVMALMKRAGFPATLRATVAGESLFNDGVGVVVFSLVLAMAVNAGADVSIQHVVAAFLQETVGGALVGLSLGWASCRLMRTIDDYNTEVLITLAVVMGGYAIAHPLHVSGPVAMAVCGLFIGNKGMAYAMSDITQDYVLKIWELIDEILNTILFFILGIEVVVILKMDGSLFLGLSAIAIVLIARIVSVHLPLGLIVKDKEFREKATSLLIWGGLRGGISVALALSIPPSPYRETILTITYVVVLFSVLVQGGLVARRMGKNTGDESLS